MKKLLTFIALIAVTAAGYGQTVIKKLPLANGDTVQVTVVTTPSTLNYATLNQSTVTLTNGGLPATINPATLNQATMTQGTTTVTMTLIKAGVVSVPPITPPVIIPSVSTTIGGIASGAITLQSNKTYSGLTIDLKNAKTTAISGKGVTNVHITKCKIINTASFGIDLNNCSNILIDSCFFSNVGVGVYAENNCAGIKVNNNQFLNINGIYTVTQAATATTAAVATNQFYGHAIQFNAVNGGGNQMNYNRIENIAGVAVHPHDILNVYHSNGLPGDSIQVIGNWIRGGQLSKWPTSNDGGCGIVLGDEYGNYQVARGNILVNPGAGGVANISNKTASTGIKIDHNIVFSVSTPVTGQGIGIDNPTQTDCGYNDSNWTNSAGKNGVNTTPYSAYYIDLTPTPLNWSTNKWADASVTANILPGTIITWNK